MADDSNPPKGTQGLVISDETQAAFGPLLELIKGSESMNNEERQYWINILPIMTPEQLKNLEDILMSEKQQLAAIDAKYAKKGGESTPQEIEEKIKKSKVEREQKENEEEEKQKTKEEDILSQIDAL